MDRRVFIAAMLAASPFARLAHARGAGNSLALGAAWRGPARDDPQFVGALAIDWEQGEVRIRHAVPVPSRAHGLSAEAGSGLLAVAMRPGTWLMRIDGDGAVVRQLQIADEAGSRRFDGHVAASLDGAWLYTTETDLGTGRGWISVRERESLRKVDEWPTHGIDPHQLLLDAEGHLMVANGGIRRDADGRKRDLDRMDSSLVRLNGRNGELLGQWRLDDRRSSLRHIAWSGSLLGIALQAEHDDPLKRAQAPVLAIWDGKSLIVPTRAADGEGYAGDIAPAPAGGFVVSGQRAGNVLLWQADRPHALQRIAEITEPCALCAGPEGVLMAGGRGLGRWHPARPGTMLRWPMSMAVDNHWVVLGA